MINARYRVDGVLGTGGVCDVFRALDLALGRYVAVKILRDTAEATTALRLFREARIMSRLMGNHVAKVYDYGELTSGQPYIVMEHLVGYDVRAILEARGWLLVDEAISLGRHIAIALSHCHQAGIIHRDLKPENVFIARHVKLIDFGLAKPSQLTATMGALTGHDSVMGTLQYMPPEQMACARDVDARSDIWSAGVILYELVTGTLPFTETNPAALVQEVFTAPIIPPSQIDPHIPQALDQIVANCLQRDRTDRFQSAFELDQALAGLPRAKSAIISSHPTQSGVV